MIYISPSKKQRPRRNNLDWSAMKAAYETGATFRQVALQFDVDYSYLRKRLVAMGVKSRHPRGRPPRPTDRLMPHWETMMFDLARGTRVCEIQRASGFSPSEIRRGVRSYIAHITRQELTRRL